MTWLTFENFHQIKTAALEPYKLRKAEAPVCVCVHICVCACVCVYVCV